jgi:hypothetical protein
MGLGLGRVGSSRTLLVRRKSYYVDFCTHFTCPPLSLILLDKVLYLGIMHHIDCT